MGSALITLPAAVFLAIQEQSHRGRHPEPPVPKDPDAVLRDLQTWVDTFGPFWGLLRREDQQRLQDLYDFDSLKFTRWTTAVLSVFALVNLAVSLTNLVAGDWDNRRCPLADGQRLSDLEGYSRWQDLNKGLSSGSVLGILVRPFAAKLLNPPAH